MGTKHPDAVHLSYYDFRSLVSDNLDKYFEGNDLQRIDIYGKITPDGLVDLLTALNYPSVRPFLWSLRGTCDMTSGFFPVVGLTYATAIKALRSEFNPLGQPRFNETEYLPVAFPVHPHADSESEYVPVLHFGLWDALHSVLRQNRDERARASDITFPELPLKSFSLSTIHQEWREFENMSFKVMGLFMAIFCDVEQPFRVPVKDPLGQWLPKAQFTLLRSSVLSDPATRYNPFVGSVTQEEACKGDLTTEVEGYLAHLRKGEAVWLRCGGRAPIDLILIHREDKKTVNIRFMDSKHSTYADGRWIQSSREEMLDKAKMVYDGLSSKIPLILKGTTVSPFHKSHLVLISNTQSREDLSPATFKWHPWSQLLFLDGVTK